MWLHLIGSFAVLIGLTVVMCDGGMNGRTGEYVAPAMGLAAVGLIAMAIA